MQAAPAPLVITTNSLPEGTVGVPYSATLAATGGTPPYTMVVDCQRVSSPGFVIDPADGGVISGTPTKPGSSSFTVQVTDASNRTATKAFTIKVRNGNLVSPPNVCNEVAHFLRPFWSYS